MYGAVAIYRLDRDPGTRRRRGTPLLDSVNLGPPLTPVGRGEARDETPLASVVWYVAATSSPAEVVWGRPVEFCYVADISQLTLLDFGSYAFAKWEWPPACHVVRIAWRRGAPPLSVDDPLASFRDIGLGQYLKDGGCRLEPPGGGTWHFRVFARSASRHYARAETMSAQAIVTFPRATVNYVLKRGVLSGSWKVEFESSDTILVPELLLVVRADTQPQKTTDGVELARIPRQHLVKGARITYPVTLTGAKGSIQLFFADDSMHVQIELRNLEPGRVW